MIDLKKISDINSKGSFKKFTKNNKIDEPLFLGNYLFHYLIMVGNLNALKFAKHPIYEENHEGLQGIHLSAKIANETKDYKIIDYFLKKYDEYIYNNDHWGRNLLNWIDEPTDNVFKLVKNNKKTDWYRLLTWKSPESSESFLHKIFQTGSSSFIHYIFNTYIVPLIDNFKKSKDGFTFNLDTTYLTRIFGNAFLKNSDIIKIYDSIDNDLLKNIVFRGNSIINFVIKFRNLDLLKYFVEVKKIDLDVFDYVNTMHPLLNSYRMYKDTGKKIYYDIAKYIWNKIKKEVKWEETNFNGQNIAFGLLDIKAEYNDTDKTPTKLEFDILKNNTIWNKLNVEKFTILSMLINFNFKKYHKILKGKKLDLSIKNGYGQIIVDEAEETGEAGWYEYFKKIKSVKEETDNIKLTNYKYSDHNIFQADFMPVSLGFIHLDEKNKKLYLPKNIKTSSHSLTFSTMFTSIFGELIEQYNNFPFFILYKDEKNYFIHPMLNTLIKNAYNEKKYDFATVFVSVDLTNRDQDLLHANVIIYNFLNKTIEYFEPYGNNGKSGNIHEILKEELTWNTGFSYLEPSDYMPVASFQFLAFENNEYELKPGDFGGYCMAWCFWYLEHRLLNPTVKPNILVQKLVNKILKGKYNLVEYIRNYANSFYENHVSVMKKLGIKKERITNLSKKNHEKELIFNYIIKKTTIGYQ